MPGTGSPRPRATLSDGVVLLRPEEDSDVGDMVLACSDPQSARWLPVPVPYGPEDARAWLARRETDELWWDWPLWAITVLPRRRWTGSVGLKTDGCGGAEVRYLVAPWARGDGISARALRLACAFGFGTLGLQVVTWSAYAGNESSRRVAQQVGFDIPDRVFPRWGAQRGERRDCWLGTLTPDALVRTSRQADARRPPPPALTPREREVLERLALGETNHEIAYQLGISVNTVKNHVRSILEKLSARSRAEAVVTSLQRGLTTLPG
jgi:DNA-binding CsgD family transcriptional regulator/RimJ/RimL family protein N-acetyltransferase